MVKSWKQKYYDLRSNKYGKKTTVILPSIAQVVLGAVGLSMVFGGTTTKTLLAGGWKPDRIGLTMGYFLTSAKTRKGEILTGLGLMSLPTFFRKMIGWRKNSTRLVKIGPASVDVV